METPKRLSTLGKLERVTTQLTKIPSVKQIILRGTPREKIGLILLLVATGAAGYFGIKPQLRQVCEIWANASQV